jgi:glycosyltransferase involved in cell wall biosynthesis
MCWLEPKRRFSAARERDKIMEPATPKISVIMPAYNTAKLIAAALDSVRQQTLRDFEIVVVNDGSPDTPELEQVLAPYFDKIIYIKQPNKRAAGARNTAIRQARGEFLAFLDSDDVWLPDHLSGQMKLFAEDPALGLAYSNCFAFADPLRTDTFMDRCPSQGSATFEALILERCQIPISTVVARKSAIVKAGLFDEGLARCDDYDMWVRTAFHGAKIGYSHTVQARLNEGRPGSLGVSDARMAEAYWKILEKLKQTLPMTESDRKIIEARSAEIRARYLIEEGKVSLREGRFSEAQAMLSEANGYSPSSKVSLVLLGLKIAPRATSKAVGLAARIRRATRSLGGGPASRQVQKA